MCHYTLFLIGAFALPFDICNKNKHLPFEQKYEPKKQNQNISKLIVVSWRCQMINQVKGKSLYGKFNIVLFEFLVNFTTNSMMNQ